MIYRFVLGYQTIHVRLPNDRPEQPRPYEEWTDKGRVWKYSICRCKPPAHPTRSEYAIGQIGAGDVVDETTSTASGTNRQKNGWRHAIPACAFAEDSECAAIELGDTTIVQAKLHLDILRVSKDVHAETRDVLFATNILRFCTTLPSCLSSCLIATLAADT
jgi:hypothetical protein